MHHQMRQLVWWLCWSTVLCLLPLLYSPQSSLLWAQTQRSLRNLSPSQRPGASPTMSAVRTRTPPGQVAGITLQDGFLSVDVREQDLRAVIESIAMQGNIDIRHLEGVPSTRVSVRFASLPLPQGLQRLLRTAEIPGYVFVTEPNGDIVSVRRIIFLAPSESPPSGRSTSVTRRVSPSLAQPPPASQPPSAPATQETAGEREEQPTSSGSVMEDIKTNTTARRLLSQLVHPNEQVRERALERLVQLVGDDQKQAELLEFLEPIMDDLASEDKGARDEARAELRKLLSQ
jgi:hypothetical protein